MYQFALTSFISLFSSTLNDPLAGGTVEQRISLLIKTLKRKLLYYVGRSLFKGDRLMYAMHLAHVMHPDMFAENEWRFFVGDLVPDLGATIPSEFPQWAAPDRVAQFKLMAQVFPMLVRKCRFSDAGLWTRWAISSQAEAEFPSALLRELTPFQRLMVVQTLRPDRLVSAMQLFVAEVLDVSSITPPPSSLQKLAEEEASSTRPVLMITTTGADPSKDLEEFATRTVGRAAYSELAMGGGQQAEALRLLKAAATEGKWLCLKNLHLVVAWLPVLEKELNALHPHERFRLWLTTESHDLFPTILLQHSIKVTYEAPPGLKKNLERTYDAWSPEFIGSGSVMRAQLLFMLAWFHGVVQERRTYVPQGWTKAYEFSMGDLRAGATVVDTLLAQIGAVKDSRAIPWQFVHGLMENAIYGGRVDNVFDMRILAAFIAEVFRPDLMGGRGLTLFGDIAVPASNSHADYLAVIAKLPNIDTPGLFSLPDNIERSVQRATSTQVITSLKALSVSAAAASSFDKDRWREKLEPMLDMWKKLTAAGDSVLDPHSAITAAKQDLASRLPVEQFVIMELAMAATLVARVNSDLQELQGVLFGTGLLTPSVQEMGSRLMAETVPSPWAKTWEGPEDPKKWLRAVVAKRVALTTWAQNVSGSLLRQPVVLSELFRPQTFLNAVRQQTARLSGTSMDFLQLVSCFDNRALSSAPLPIVLKGLTLQGAQFESGVLTMATASTSELVPLPPITVAWMPLDAPPPYPPESTYVSPVYESLEREGVLTQLSLPVEGALQSWIMNGVAVFLGSD